MDTIIGKHQKVLENKVKLKQEEIIATVKELFPLLEKTIEEYAKSRNRDLESNEVLATAEYIMATYKARLQAVGINYFQLRDIVKELNLNIEEPNFSGRNTPPPIQ